MSDCCDIVLAGAAIIDIPVVPVDASVFTRISSPADRIIMTSGGDAMNEALVLSRLGKAVRLITRIGKDDAGAYLKNICQSVGMDTTYMREIDGLDTGINVVLVDQDGERRFLTNPHGSLRALQVEDIVPEALQQAKIFCFASIFVFPRIGSEQLEQLFRMVREQGLIVCADMTSPKQGETVHDLAPALRWLDYLFANETEAQAVTGAAEPADMAHILLETGVRHVIIKIGSRGCLIADQTGYMEIIPACPDTRCIDTTGAGDNFAAGFFAALLDGRSFADCARFANAAAAVSVEAVGASTGVQSAEQVMQRCKAAYHFPDFGAS